MAEPSTPAEVSVPAEAAGVPDTPASLLRVRDLAVEFRGAAGWVRVTNGVTFDVAAGETLCLVGETGCGKSVTGLAMMRLIRPPRGRIAEGTIEFKGTDVLALPEPKMRDLRGNRIGMIYQEPMSAINGVFTIGDQIAEGVRRHQRLNRRAAMARAVDMLDLVGIPGARQRVHDYPHMFSGGMLQRVFVAMALANEPDLLIADEPTTALDVTVQLQILDLLKDLQQQMGLGVLLITHDLGVVADMADRVAVMYAGQIVELAPVAELFRTPRHPYTEGLLASMPATDAGRARPERLGTIPGRVPTPDRFPNGCRFHPRCGYCIEDRCDSGEPALRPTDGGAATRCVRADELTLQGVD